MCKSSTSHHNRILCFISALVVGASFLLPSFEVSAADTSVVEDTNGDGQITYDEVDIEQLTTYGLLTGYGVTGSDLTGSITSSTAYSDAIASLDDTVLIGTVADGKVTFSEWFETLCTNIYAEITGKDVVGYTVVPSISHSDLIDLLFEYNSVVAFSDYDFNSVYNYLSSEPFAGDFVILYDSNYYVLKESSDYLLTRSPGAYFFNSDYGYQLCIRYYNGSSWTTYYSKFSYYYVYQGGYSSTGSSSQRKFYLDSSASYFCVDGPSVIFNSGADVLSYFNFVSSLYYSSVSNNSLISTSVDNLNGTDWELLSETVYSNCKNAVESSDIATATDIQNIIDSELSDISGALEDMNTSTESTNNSLLNIYLSMKESADTQIGWLEKIHALLVQWLPFLENVGSGGGGDTSAITDALEQNELNEETRHDEIMDTEGSSNVESLPDDSITDLNTKEDELLQDTTDAESSLDFQIDSSANAVIMGLLDSFILVNDKVYRTYLGVLTLGFVALVLNR